MGGRFQYIFSPHLYVNASLAIGLNAYFICFCIYWNLGSLFKIGFWENLIKMEFPSLWLMSNTSVTMFITENCLLDILLLKTQDNTYEIECSAFSWKTILVADWDASVTHVYQENKALDGQRYGPVLCSLSTPRLPRQHFCNMSWAFTGWHWAMTSNIATATQKMLQACQ